MSYHSRSPQPLQNLLITTAEEAEGQSAGPTRAGGMPTQAAERGRQRKPWKKDLGDSVSFRASDTKRLRMLAASKHLKQMHVQTISLPVQLFTPAHHLW